MKHWQARQRRLARHLAAARVESPRATICRVFGTDCNDAVRVAQCESGLQTTARNGQYLGLFQMGTLARQLFGHGDSAEVQAHAALRYFVASGRDWSPWSCQAPLTYSVDKSVGPLVERGEGVTESCAKCGTGCGNRVPLAVGTW